MRKNDQHGIIVTHLTYLGVVFSCRNRLSHSFSCISRILLICVHLLATLRVKREDCEAVYGSNKSNQRNITKKPTRQNPIIAIYEALARTHELGTT